VCQRNKNHTKAPAGKLMPNTVPEKLLGNHSEAITVMNIEWDYNYYQLWSDNEWLVDEMLAMLDKDMIM